MRLAAFPKPFFHPPPNQARSDVPSGSAVEWSMGGGAPGQPDCPLLLECCRVNHQRPVTASISHTAAVAL